MSEEEVSISLTTPQGEINVILRVPEIMGSTRTRQQLAEKVANTASDLLEMLDDVLAEVSDTVPPRPAQQEP